jgi:two-component system response regulator YesN
MIKVLVVDDDKMARQGLILSIHWEAFGMRVIGEAPNGQKALEFLAVNPVDLVLTDLAMPVLSGLELMRTARAQFPSVVFAVLTFHEDFEFTREALRLGAIDYISKLQLERENLDAVLSRIRDRFSGDLGKDSQVGGNRALVFFSIRSGAEAQRVRAELPVEAEVEEVGPGVLVWRFDRDPHQRRLIEEFQPEAEPSGWHLVHLVGLLGENRPRVEHLLRQYHANALFYDYQATGPADLTLAELERAVAAPQGEPDLANLRSQLSSLNWLHHPSAFETLVKTFRAARLPSATLVRLLAVVESDLNRHFGRLTGCSMELTGTITLWSDVESWLGGMRDFIYSSLDTGSHSREAKAGALRALKIIHEEFGATLHAEEVARRVNMSRSHFCLCFREIIGDSFLSYLSDVRISQAKELLRNTDLAIYEVAERTGYADERYFSRLFRKAVGILPRDYRLSGR